MPAKLTNGQKSALKWLADRGGDACFDRNGVAFAQGEHAPVYRATWNALRDAGLIELYAGKQQGGSGYGRLRLTEAARAAAQTKASPVRQSKFTGARNRAPMLDEEQSA